MVDSGARSASALPAASRPAQRWLARFAFLAAAAATVLVLAVAGLRGGIALLVVAVAGMATALAGVWWFLTHRGLLRWLAAAVVILAPLAVAVLYARARLVWVVVVFALLWSAALAAGRQALSASAARPREHDTPPPRRPYLIMNPRSGGGKVGRFGLVQRARALGAEVVLLDGAGTDVAGLARQAVHDGADLLGVAGGDGTQALVAGIAAEHGLPFMVVSAGTRNHFALDLGLDREDPASCLDALTDGVELRVDLGMVGSRTFVNNASFGAYAAVVQSPAYRDDKTRTTLDLLPGLLTGQRGPGLRLSAGDTVVAGPQAVLVSNNPYATGDIAGLGHRLRLDGGVLGVLAVRVRGAFDAAGLVRGRRRSGSLTVVTADEAVIDADAPSVSVGIDGEAVTMPTPVRCTIRPGVLRVRVPRRRPGAGSPRPELDWVRLRRLALPAGRA
ncbi:diacylglycerol/lipid kinase family protein [Couchioplanes caeruleus]|uniref:Diacylglycerol kinase n=2 Tax=Couchioplanes caeruleus TaxID=56438 RepID=A0A1K0FA41_9ACTN|nr:diacylglycerol kinase family protein [Couchioplanes caeruleus]OJF09741.1 diacylglycerol kinase [Couchioplanes caeruleus subsp. caeruleus]ROP28737.1 diacylglycerol kinase family enzyme [Couchioplanes caeruleus]